jgi:two-component system OmpR family sensor kinase
MSLRGRLLVLLLALVALGLVASDVATYTILNRFLLQRVDQQLNAARTIEFLVVQFPSRVRNQADTLGNRMDAYIEVRDPSGRVIRAISSARETSVPKIPRTLPKAGVDSLTRPSVVPTPQGAPTPPLPATVDSDGDPALLTVPSFGHGPHWRLRVARVPNGDTVVVGLPLTDVAANLHYLKWIEFAVSGGVLIVAVAAGLWLVRVGLHPLSAIEDTAEEIAAGDLSRRVPEGSPRTEVGRLARALNGMLSHIERAFTERQASEERLRQFVADASHELRTPLTSIRGYSELFRRGADHRPEDLAKTMRGIEAEATRMGVLVDDLLLLARLDQGRPLERRPVELTQLAHHAVDAAMVIDDRHPLTLDTNGAVWVLGDRARLRQVIDNLLANVRTHTPPGTSATVRVAGTDRRAVIEVADQGPGLTPDRASRVWERFYRADPSRSRDSGGSGLGLAIVDSIATAHGGRVDLHSEVGHGATFHVELPLTDPGQDNEAGVRAQVSRASG